ncbi:MAG: hypothetical protein H6739_03025 [Alphaproteobacteria bacterium]|nr:hypothetical protein [Alphaproteobacteria bacterium]
MKGPLFVLAPALALAALTGCASECKDPQHINGSYTVFSTATPNETQSTALGVMATYVPFYNGTRDWEIRYVPASGKVTMLIDAQELTANYTEDPTNCNLFQLEVKDGAWSGDATQITDTEPVTSNHSISWTAELVWQGDDLSGSYAVTDNWTKSTAESGTYVGTGYLSGTLQGDE